MSLERAGIILCCFVIALAIVGCIVQHQERKSKKLPPPRPDERDWQGIFMKDVK